MGVRCVLITGCSTGIGFATAVSLDARGWIVFAGVRKQQDAQRLQRLLSRRARTLLLDVEDSANIAGAIACVREWSPGGLDGLVNNAGIVYHGPSELLGIAALRRLCEVNLFGLAELTLAALPLLRQSAGRVVNVGSISGRVAWPFNGMYAASKHAVRGFTDSLRMELAAQGIRVALIEPGIVKTAIWRKLTPPRFRDVEHLPASLAAHYTCTMAYIDRAMALSGERGAEPAASVEAIRHALEARRPRACYLVGKDAYAQLLFSQMPAFARDRAIAALARRLAGAP